MYEINKDEMIKNIKIRMIIKGINQSELAEALGMQQGNLSKALNPKTKDMLTLNHLFAIAEILDISIDSLLGRDSYVTSKLTPQKIGRIISSLFEQGFLESFKQEIEEERGFTVGYDRSTEKIIVTYTMLYFKNYWEPPSHEVLESLNEDQILNLEQDYYYVGNELYDNMAINTFLRSYTKIYKMYHDGELDKDEYTTFVDSLISKLPDK